MPGDVALSLSLDERQILNELCCLGPKKDPAPYRLVFEILLRNRDLKRTLRSEFKGELQKVAAEIYQARGGSMYCDPFGTTHLNLQLSPRGRRNLDVLMQTLSTLAREEGNYPYYYDEAKALKELLLRVKEGLEWKGKLARWKRFKEFFAAQLRGAGPVAKPSTLAGPSGKTARHTPSKLSAGVTKPPARKASLVKVTRSRRAVSPSSTNARQSPVRKPNTLPKASFQPASSKRSGSSSRPASKSPKRSPAATKTTAGRSKSAASSKSRSPSSRTAAKRKTCKVTRTRKKR